MAADFVFAARFQPNRRFSRRISRIVLRGNASNHHHDEGNAKIKKQQVLLSKINLTVNHTFWTCFAITARVTLSNLQEWQCDRCFNL